MTKNDGTKNPLKQLRIQGQSVWLDYLRRSLITSGTLDNLVEEYGVTGVISNFSVFRRVIEGTEEYSQTLADHSRTDDPPDARDVYEQIIVQETQRTADVLQSVYEKTNGNDGFVCMDVPPDTTDDSKTIVEEAKRLRTNVDRPNVMLNVPATDPGLTAIEILISEGVNVNARLIFSLERYEKVTDAYLRGLEICDRPSEVRSVASVRIGPVTRAVDRKLEDLGTEQAEELKGAIAIAVAKHIYDRFQEKFYGDRFRKLSENGARPQRVLWSGTTSKQPGESGIRFVEELVGPNTVHAASPATLHAFRNDGMVRGATLTEDLHTARRQLNDLKGFGIYLDEVADDLQEAEIKKYNESFVELIGVIDERTSDGSKPRVPDQNVSMGTASEAVNNRLSNWAKQNFAGRLWAKDPTIWFEDERDEITNRLGWLDLPEVMKAELGKLNELSAEIYEEGYADLILMGMGGSSLAPEVFQRTFGNREGYPALTVLDSTHPGAVRAVEEKIDLNKTLFLVASKSGKTVETLSFFRYFWRKLDVAVDRPGDQFIATTDPETPLEQLAGERGFRNVFRAHPNVGGRYSALTVFGMVPAALIGMDVHEFLDRARTMAEACAFCVSPPDNPALRLGAALGELVRTGRDKVTLIPSSSVQSFPDWLEQLLAESTGKDGTGLIPVVDEPEVSPSFYGEDRVFVYITTEGEISEKRKEKLKMLKNEGHPVISIELDDLYDLSQEMFRWEMATAAAGAVMHIHPFNQPNVDLTKKLTREVMEDGSGEMEEFEETKDAVRHPEKAAKALFSLLEDGGTDDYFAIQAFLNPRPDVRNEIEKLRGIVTNNRNIATTFGYGPRYLHATGQVHKGGPDTGIFLQFVDDPAEGVDVPETAFSFGELIQAQSVGDYRALKQRGQRVLRINLGKKVQQTLAEFVKTYRDVTKH